MQARIGSSIEVDYADLPAGLRDAVEVELSVRNPERERALGESSSAAQLPARVPLWTEAGEYGQTMVIPRGYAGRLEQLTEAYDDDVEWVSTMTCEPFSRRLFRDWAPASLRDYQERARDTLLDWGSGILQMPTGGGKSRTILEAIRWAGQRTLVVVGKVALATQWVEAVREVYDYEAGYVGEGRWDERDLTVCVWQTLWSRRDEIPREWYTKFGFVVHDEVHHVSSECMSDLIQRFPAFYRIGLSATPDWDELLFPIVKAVVGPVVHTTSRDEVGDHLLTPTIEVVETEFEFDYHGTYTHRGRTVRNNYGDLQTAISTDHARNTLIVELALREARAGHHVLVVTRRIEHVKQLLARLERSMSLGRDLHVLTGDQTGADAQRVARSLESAECGTVLVSTVSDEGIDIPKLDRLILAFPVRNTSLIEQQIGRVLRPASDKKDSIVYDLRDKNVGVLLSQHITRSKKLYIRRRWPVVRGAQQ